MTVALAMSAEKLANGGTEEDRLLLAQFRDVGIDAKHVAWDSATAWQAFGGVLIRSCWDYHLRPAEFRQWLDELEAVGATVWNDISLLRWNMDKRYLVELEQRGAAVIPTLVRDSVSASDFPSLTARLGTDRLVIKPVIGATAYGCRLVSSQRDLVAEGDGPWLVQPFVPAVAEEGEWSLMLFDGEFSHAVCKQAREGEFRVQKEFGGSSQRHSPDGEFLAAARDLLAGLAKTPVYARVDLATWRGTPHLMELELIEPDLFLRPGDRGIESLIRHASAVGA